MKNLKSAIITFWDDAETNFIFLAILLLCVLIFGMYLGSNIQQRTDRLQIETHGRIINAQDRN